MRPIKSVFLASTLCLVGCLETVKGDWEPIPAGSTVGMTIVHTTDIHSRLLPYDLAPLKTDADLGLAPEAPPYGGVARVAAMINREKARANRVLLLDSGDYFQGGPIFNSSDGEPEVRWMSLMGYDGVVMGNHEFDKGVANFSDKINRFATYPLLTANYWWEGRGAASDHNLANMSAPYTITNVKGLRVGIIGMASIGSMYGLTDGGNSLNATPLEQNETTRAYLSVLQPVTDLIVVLSHLGLNEDQDLVTGYDAYYSYEKAKDFLNRSDDDPSQWKQLEPPLETCAAEQTPRDQCTFLDGSIRVFIPGVSGIDIIEGGHLHVVLNPPQVIRDPKGRPVIISHSGAFAKYVGRLELGVQMPPAKETKPDVAEDSAEMLAWIERQRQGAEVVSHDYRAFPVDSIWCDDEARSWRATVQFEQFRALINTRPTETKDGQCRDQFHQALPGALAEKCIANYDRDFRSYECDRYLPMECKARVERCAWQEDLATTDLLNPYIVKLDQNYALTRIFAYAPRAIARRNSSTGGDSPLGNMTADSMRMRKRVEAEIALTNTLGIRDNLYPGPVTLESMFNVFPFENTINIMYLSGAEVQELADYVARRSTDRGCQAQAQISGMTFTMDCAQEQENLMRYPCQVDADCDVHGAVQHEDGWRCTEEQVCSAHQAFKLTINGKPLDLNGSYKIAVNDYIARGGSGFKVLKRNTTRIETGISLRDSLIDYLRGLCTCEDILGISTQNKDVPDDKKRSETGFMCATGIEDNKRVIDPIVMAWCRQANTFDTLYRKWLADKSYLLPNLNSDQCTCEKALAADPSCKSVDQDMLDYCSLSVGKCTCAQVMAGDEKTCGHVTPELKNFCSSPLRIPIAIGEEDGRIGRRVK